MIFFFIYLVEYLHVVRSSLILRAYSRTVSYSPSVGSINRRAPNRSSTFRPSGSLSMEIRVVLIFYLRDASIPFFRPSPFSGNGEDRSRTRLSRATRGSADGRP